MGNEVVIKGINDIDVIKHRIYEVRCHCLKSQFVNSNLERANSEGNIPFAIEIFDRKTMMETKQGAKMAA